MDNLKSMLGMRRKDRTPSTRVRGYCRVKNGVNERIDEGILRWWRHIKIIESSRITERVYERETMGSRILGRQ